MTITAIEKARREALKRTLKPGVFVTCGAPDAQTLLRSGGKFLDVGPETESDADRRERERKAFNARHHYWIYE